MQGSPLNGATVQVEGSMPDNEGMHPLQASLREVQDGRYEAPFSWTMEGDWSMAVTLTMSDGQRVSRQFDVKVDPKRNADHNDQMAEQPKRVPNNGAKIELLSPQDGAAYKLGEEVTVRIATQNFELAQEGNHWHIFVNGKSYSMIMGDMTEARLPDLPAGKYEISVYLSIGTHEELEEGSAVIITVYDPDKGD
jgi:hypothetical protein